ncbi:protein of unknown function [Methylacidimicrobium sp. AP8]|nr:protein of unknown function [Methylacidimicrobium sp. AP8]
MTAPEQGAQQEWRRTFLAPKGGSSVGAGVGRRIFFIVTQALNGVPWQAEVAGGISRFPHFRVTGRSARG